MKIVSNVRASRYVSGISTNSKSVVIVRRFSEKNNQKSKNITLLNSTRIRLGRSPRQNYKIKRTTVPQNILGTNYTPTYISLFIFHLKTHTVYGTI